VALNKHDVSSGNDDQNDVMDDAIAIHCGNRARMAVLRKVAVAVTFKPSVAMKSTNLGKASSED